MRKATSSTAVYLAPAPNAFGWYTQQAGRTAVERWRLRKSRAVWVDPRRSGLRSAEPESPHETDPGLLHVDSVGAQSGHSRAPLAGAQVDANKRNVQKMHCIGVLLRFTLRALFRAVASHANGTLTRGGARVPQSARSRAEGSYERRPAFTSASAASVVCTAPHVSAQRAGGSPPRFVRSRSEH